MNLPTFFGFSNRRVVRGHGSFHGLNAESGTEENPEPDLFSLYQPLYRLRESATKKPPGFRADQGPLAAKARLLLPERPQQSPASPISTVLD